MGQKMNKRAEQLDLFCANSLNPVYEIKRALRIALSKTHLSRDQIVDEMNRLAVSEGMRKSVSKVSMDGWLKNSDPDRLPSLIWLTIFCKVLDDPSPIAAILRPLGCDLIDERGRALLGWAESELSKRKAAKKAKVALAQVEEL